MTIDTKNILFCLWKIIMFSMQFFYKYVSENPVFSSVSLFFILLYMFSPTFFAFIIYSLLILISAYGFYRVFFNGDDKNTDIVKTYKKNDGDPSNLGTNGNISDNFDNKNREKFTQKSNIEDKNMVCSTRSHDDKVDKSVNVEENVKVDKSANVEENVEDTKEVKVDSVTDGAECSPCKPNEHVISQINVGCDEGLRSYSRIKESSETSEDSQEDRNEDEQKSVMDSEDSDIERSRRLESMIARRKARRLFSFQVRHTIMSAGNNDPVEHLASILVPRSNHLISNNLNDHAPPGSAPSVLLPMHNPFDIPYDTHEERPDLTDESFQQEFLAENKDVLCRHASFRWGALFSLATLGDQDGMVTNDIPFSLRAPQKLKNPALTLRSHLENKDVGEVIQKESCQEKEAISNGCSAEDHATQEGQVTQQGPDSVDIHHKEDKSDTQKKERIAENIVVGSSSSSSSEESLPVCRPNKDEIIRSLNSFRRNVVLPVDDDYQVNGYTHDSDQTILNNIKSDGGFLYARVMNDHARSNSLASDMLVEVSEISSPRSIPSLDEEYSGNEEVKEVSSHASRVGTNHESNPREVPEISDQQDNSGGVSRINHNAEANTSDVLPEKVFKENSINSCNSLSSSRTGLPDSTQTHSVDSNIEDLSESSLQNQQNEKRDYNGGSEYQPSQDILSDNPTSVQSNHSLGSPENRRDEEVVSEFEFPVSSAENEASGLVSEIETEQVPNISSSGSSPKSVLQPKFSSDHVSSMDLSQGISTEYQQSHHLIVDDDSVLPVLDLNHFAFQIASPRQDDSTSQSSHVIDRLQSPRFVDALYCMPFQSKLEERENHDASMTTSASSFYQDIHDPYPHQSNFNKEADTNNHSDNSLLNDNQARTNLEYVENIEGDNHKESSTKHETAAVFMDSSNPYASNSIEDTKEGIKEIDGKEGAFSTYKLREGNPESSPDVKLKEFQEATLDDVANQPQEAEAKDSSVASKAPDTVFDKKQTELKNSTGNLMEHVDIKDPLDRPPERTMEETDNSTSNQNDPVITDLDDSELKSVKGDIEEASEHVIRPEDVHNSLELDANLDSKSTSDVVGGLTNQSEVEITAVDHE